MKTDTIKAVEIDTSGRLCITPESHNFSFIYRAALEVNWDKDGRFLFAPRPRNWSYLDWFKQIIGGVQSEYGCQLQLCPATEWKNIPPTLREDIQNWMVA